MAHTTLSKQIIITVLDPDFWLLYGVIVYMASLAVSVLVSVTMSYILLPIEATVFLRSFLT